MHKFSIKHEQSKKGTQYLGGQNNFYSHGDVCHEHKHCYVLSKLYTILKILLE